MLIPAMSSGPRPMSGWVVGHSYIVYAPLVYGNTTIVFEGKPVGTPDAGTFWRVISEHGVKSLFTAPTAFRAIKRADPNADLIPGFDLSCLKSLFLAGERSDPDTVEWARTHLQVPVLDHWWQTETGYTIAGYPWGKEKIPVKLGSAGVPMPGFDVRILDDECNEVPRGELGSIAVRLPLPPGCLPTLWNADERYQEAYLSRFEGYYDTGDAGSRMKTVIAMSWPGPMMSSTSPGIACRRVKWKRFSPTTQMLQNARSLGFTTS